MEVWQYPNCNVSYPDWVGDGSCDDTRSGYNVPECGMDGGDCADLNAFREKYPTCDDSYYYKVGDGHCDNLSGYNTPACGMDGGDCEGFNAMKQKYPDCPFEEYAYLRMGNGVCDFIVFDYIVSLDPFFSHRVFINTSECGYDNGDCDNFGNPSEEDDTSPSIFFNPVLLPLIRSSIQYSFIPFLFPGLFWHGCLDISG